MGRRRHLTVLEQMHVTDVGAGGKAIARHGEMVVFVRNAVPGDVVDVQLVRKRKRFMEGIPVRFHVYSEKRAEPFCQHFGICGGCTWQQLPYNEQIKYKEKQVSDNLKRIGRVEVIIPEPIVASPAQTHYRNKLEFTFSANRWLVQEEIDSDEIIKERRALGFHIPGKYDKVLDINTCYLQAEPSNAIRIFVRNYALQNNLEFFNLNRPAGLLRNLIIRNTAAGEFMVTLSCFRNDASSINRLLSALSLQFPEITSLYYVINNKANDTIHDLDMVLFKGKEYLEEVMEDLHFRISPKSFFQINTQQAYTLYCIVRLYADLSGNETVYDLYTGTGTIALFLARHCRKVIGIDHIDEAIQDAVRNAEMNRLDNTEFISGDIRELLNEQLTDRYGVPDVIVTDPPRTGMHKEVVKALMVAAPRKIVYVSCNPATQARDIQMFSHQYDVIGSQPVDMFPHTVHVENVVLLHRK